MFITITLIIIAISCSSFGNLLIRCLEFLITISISKRRCSFLLTYLQSMLEISLILSILFNVPVPYFLIISLLILYTCDSCSVEFLVFAIHFVCFCFIVLDIFGWREAGVPSFHGDLFVLNVHIFVLCATHCSSLFKVAISSLNIGLNLCVYCICA